VIIPITVVIFILLSFFYSIPFLNDTNDIYFSFALFLKIVGRKYLFYGAVSDILVCWR